MNGIKKRKRVVIGRIFSAEQFQRMANTWRMSSQGGLFLEGLVNRDHFV